jgi:hypothetical protein
MNIKQNTHNEEFQHLFKTFKECVVVVFLVQKLKMDSPTDENVKTTQAGKGQYDLFSHVEYSELV